MDIDEVTEFPYKSYYLDANKLFYLALQYKPEYIQSERSSETELIDRPIFSVITRANNLINYLTDCFSEQERIKCRVSLRDTETLALSPLQFYQKNKEKLVKILDKQGKKLTFRNLNNLIYESKGVKACTNYKITYLLGILEKFRPKRWLDSSGGWGDRLLSACISHRKYGLEEYVSIDPNTALNPYYNEIVKQFGTEKFRTKFYIEKAEDFSTENYLGRFDFIFTSPPFFTYEIYTEEQKKDKNLANIRDWLDNFLFVVLRKSYEMLSSGGNLLMYIEDKPDYRFIPEFIEYTVSLGLKYEGFIQQIYKDPKYPGKDTYKKVYWFKK
jgi:hypothetical protein